jgi:hypothetical protein
MNVRTLYYVEYARTETMTHKCDYDGTEITSYVNPAIISPKSTLHKSDNELSGADFPGRRTNCSDVDWLPPGFESLPKTQSSPPHASKKVSSCCRINMERRIALKGPATLSQSGFYTRCRNLLAMDSAKRCQRCDPASTNSICGSWNAIPQSPLLTNLTDQCFV